MRRQPDIPNPGTRPIMEGRRANPTFRSPCASSLRQCSPISFSNRRSSPNSTLHHCPPSRVIVGDHAMGMKPRVVVAARDLPEGRRHQGRRVHQHRAPLLPGSSGAFSAAVSPCRPASRAPPNRPRRTRTAEQGLQRHRLRCRQRDVHQPKLRSLDPAHAGRKACRLGNRHLPSDRGPPAAPRRGEGRSGSTECSAPRQPRHASSPGRRARSTPYWR